MVPCAVVKEMRVVAKRVEDNRNNMTKSGMTDNM